MRGADRGPQVGRVVEGAGRQQDGPGAQAVDPAHVALERQRHEVGVGGVVVELEREVPGDRAGQRRARAGDLDERSDQRGDEQPRALVDGVGVGPQRRCGRRDGPHRRGGRGDGDDHRRVVARALARQLGVAARELGFEQRTHPRRALCARHGRPEVVHPGNLLRQECLHSVRCSAYRATRKPWKLRLHSLHRSACRAAACASTASPSTTRCAVRLAREREEAGDDVAGLVVDAIAIGARVLDREQTGANAEFVKAEFEKAARELDAEFVDRARRVAERLDQRIDDVFGPENGHLTKALARHFGDESSVAVSTTASRRCWPRCPCRCATTCAASSPRTRDSNPLATFQRDGDRRHARERAGADAAAALDGREARRPA